MTITSTMRRRSNRRGSRSYDQLPFAAENAPVDVARCADMPSPSRASPRLRNKKSASIESQNLVRKRKRVDDSSPSELDSRSSVKKLALNDEDSPTFSVKSFYGGAGPTEKLAQVKRDLHLRHIEVQPVKRSRPLRVVPPTNVLALVPNKSLVKHCNQPMPAAVPGNAPSPKAKENRRFFVHKACDRRRRFGTATVTMRKGFHLKYKPGKSHNVSETAKLAKKIIPRPVNQNVRPTTEMSPPTVPIMHVQSLADRNSPDLFRSSNSEASQNAANKDSGVASDNTTEADTLLGFLDDDASVCSNSSSRDSINLFPCASSQQKKGDISEEQKQTSKQFYPLFTARLAKPLKPNSPSTPSARRLAALPQGSATCSPASSQASPKQLLRSLKGRDGKEQMTLDFGQKLIGAVRCDICGMTYTRGEPGDETTHSKFHQRLSAVLKFPGWKRERVVHEYIDGSRIIVIMPDDKFAAKKIEAVRKIVDDELGFVVEGQHTAAKTKTFLYISADKRIVGCCIAEVAQQGYRLLQNEGVGARPWCCSSQSVPVKCGVSRIWVLSSERRKGIATKLLDSVRFTFLLGCPLRLDEIAFSGPTPNGKSLATSYFGSPSFLVYNHQQR